VFNWERDTGIKPASFLAYETWQDYQPSTRK